MLGDTKGISPTKGCCLIEWVVVFTSLSTQYKSFRRRFQAIKYVMWITPEMFHRLKRMPFPMTMNDLQGHEWPTRGHEWPTTSWMTYNVMNDLQGVRNDLQGVRNDLQRHEWPTTSRMTYNVMNDLQRHEWPTTSRMTYKVIHIFQVFSNVIFHTDVSK